MERALIKSDEDEILPTRKLATGYNVCSERLRSNGQCSTEVLITPFLAKRTRLQQKISPGASRLGTPAIAICRSISFDRNRLPESARYGEPLKTNSENLPDSE